MNGTILLWILFLLVWEIVVLELAKERRNGKERRYRYMSSTLLLLLLLEPRNGNFHTCFGICGPGMGLFETDQFQGPLGFYTLQN